MQGMFTRNEARIQLASSATFTNTYQLSLNNPYLPVGTRNQLCAGRSISAANCAAAAAVKGGPGTPGYVEIPVIAQPGSSNTGRAAIRSNRRCSRPSPASAGTSRPLSTSTCRRNMARRRSTRRARIGAFSKVQQSLRAYRNAAGQPVCADGTNGCVPLNLFGPQGSITQDMLNFIDLDAQINRRVKQTVVNGAINGDLSGVRSPLADSNIGFAIGTEYRKISAAANPDAPSQIQGEVLGTGARTPPDVGKYDVKEAFGESLPADLHPAPRHHARLVPHPRGRRDHPAGAERHPERLLFDHAQPEPDAERLLRPHPAQPAEREPERRRRDQGRHPRQLEPRPHRHCRLGPGDQLPRAARRLVRPRRRRPAPRLQRLAPRLLPFPGDAELDQPRLHGLLQHQLHQSAAALQVERPGELGPRQGRDDLAVEPHQAR